MHESIAGRGRIHQLRPAFSPVPSLAFAPFVPVAPLSGNTTFSPPLTVYDRSNKMRALSMGAGGLRGAVTATWNYHDSLATNKLYTFGDIDPSIMILICVNIQKFECAAE